MANNINQRITNKIVWDELKIFGDKIDGINSKLIPILTIIKPLKIQVGKNTSFRLKVVGGFKVIGILFIVGGLLLKILKII